MGTWGLTKAELNRLDTYYRRHLRQIAAIHWPHRISNETLHRRCRCRPISEVVLTARWRLFGHVFRMSPDAPAQLAIDYYFVHSGSTSFRGRPRTTLLTALPSHWMSTTLPRLLVPYSPRAWPLHNFAGRAGPGRAGPGHTYCGPGPGLG